MAAARVLACDTSKRRHCTEVTCCAPRCSKTSDETSLDADVTCLYSRWRAGRPDPPGQSCLSAGQSSSLSPASTSPQTSTTLEAEGNLALKETSCCGSSFSFERLHLFTFDKFLQRIRCIQQLRNLRSGITVKLSKLTINTTCLYLHVKRGSCTLF